MNKRKLNLYCFSPPVMLATFAIEVGLAVYTLWRYHASRVTQLAATMLICLAAFQMAEYMVCGGTGNSAMHWSRLGYIAITMLPPLGIHLVSAIAGKSNRAIVGGAYAAAAAFIGYFIFTPMAFTGHECLGNYVIFQVGSTASIWYGWYYYGLLFVGIGLSWWFSRNAEPKISRALQAFIAGYVVFMLPTTTVNLIDPSTVAGNPSIMCGFAVLFALVMANWVLPAVAVPKLQAKNASRQIK